jgi:hypothetical protein
MYLRRNAEATGNLEMTKVPESDEKCQWRVEEFRFL